ncbi:MAG: hypothetical protein ACE5FV_00940 [Woeseia sp.]
MRELDSTELSLVSGAGEGCSGNSGNSGGSGNNLGGVTDSDNFGDDLVNIYEGLVQAASHIIERVADAIKN